MPHEDIEWISPFFLGTNIDFPNDTTWRLTEVLAEKDTFFDEGPAEASAVFNCIQQAGPQADSRAVIRVRMQYMLPNLSHHGSH